ncbi:MAG: metal-dependent hydrolase [Paludibacter sp. 47-17]|nr:MAG: metal-dependent hydrolase [Paludibacter sp. SCN 50-10]OJX88855.1 MAG: metal-dependent hydrolase [Paludibacter sp. 47-17]
MEILHIRNISVEVEWKNIKNIHLTLYPPDARIHISAPVSMTKEAVRLFVISKQQWINQRVEMIKSQSRQTQREYVSGENHYFKGIRYRLNVFIRNAPPCVTLSGTRYINLQVREGSNTTKRAEIMKEWYRNELKQVIAPLIEKWEELLTINVNHWEIKQMKTQWGSCNHNAKRIIFNLELIKKPTHCIEYIVLHEMLHLIERLHTSRYIALLDIHMPNWRNIKNELNEFIV